MLSLLTIVTASAASFLITPGSQVSLLDVSAPNTLFMVPLDEPGVDLSRFTVATPEGEEIPLSTLLRELSALEPDMGGTLELETMATGAFQARVAAPDSSGPAGQPQYCSALYERRCSWHGVICTWVYVGDVCCSVPACGDGPFIGSP